MSLFAISALLIFSIPKPEQKIEREPTTLSVLLGGFRYVFNQKIVLGAISLDLFAVLLGGAVALLPIYARDILEIGEEGLGLLRAALQASVRFSCWPLSPFSRSRIMPA